MTGIDIPGWAKTKEMLSLLVQKFIGTPMVTIVCTKKTNAELAECLPACFYGCIPLCLPSSRVSQSAFVDTFTHSTCSLPTTHNCRQEEGEQCLPQLDFWF